MRLNSVKVVKGKHTVDWYIALCSLTDLPTLRSNLLLKADCLMQNVCFYILLRSTAINCFCYCVIVSLLWIFFSSYFFFSNVCLHFLVLYEDISCVLLLFSRT